MVVDDMAFQVLPPLGLAPHLRVRTHVQKKKEVLIGQAQMNVLHKIPIKERRGVSKSKLQCLCLIV